MRDVPAGGRPVTIRRFDITGNSVISTPVLLSMVRRYEGTTMTLEEIFAVADQLTSYYHSQGYGLATVTVPAQRVDEGIITFEVIEGRVSEVRFRGNQRFSSEFLRTQVDELGSGQVFRSDAMEREALLLNDIPGLATTAVISPGAEYGTSDITFNVEETPHSYRFSVDNYGRQSIGEWRYVLDMNFHGLGGRADRFNVGGVLSTGSRMRYAKLAYGFAVGDQGGRVRISANRSYYSVGGPVFIPLQITGSSDNFRAEYIHPMRRTRQESTVVGVALTYTDASSYSQFLGIETSSTQIGLLELSWATQRRMSNGWLASMGAIVATNFEPVKFDSGNQRLEGSQQRGRLELYGNFTIPLSGNWSLLARARAQLSVDPLVDTQQFSVGGPGSVRGYGPSEQRGDRGAFVSAEFFRYATMGTMPVTWSFFVDTGRVWRIEHQFSGPDLNASMVSAGLGLTVNPGGPMYARFEYARSFDTFGGYVATDGEDDRVWVNFVAEF